MKTQITDSAIITQEPSAHFELRTDWRDEHGDQLSGSDERVIGVHPSLDSARAALGKISPAHPHNHAQIWEVRGEDGLGLEADLSELQKHSF